MYNAGTANLQIRASFRGIQTQIRKEAKIIADQLEKAVQSGLDKGFRGSDPTRQGKEQGNRFGTTFAETVRKRISEAMRSLPDAKIDADTSQVDRRIQEIRKELKELSGKRIGIDVDETTALARLKELQAELDKISKESASIRVAADTSAASAKLAAIQKDVDKVAKDSPNIKVGADTEGAKAKIREIGLEADKLGAKRETIGVKVDSREAERSLARVARSSDNTSKRMGRGAKLAIGYSAAIGLLSPVAGAGAVGLINLAGAILPVSGLLAGLPAAILGTVGAMTVLHVALNNVGSAISAGLSGDTKQFEQAMGKLTGTAQNFVNAIVKLKPQLDTLKNSLQSHLLAGMASQFTYMANKVLPRLSGPLNRVADGFNAIFRAALKAVGTAKNIASMRGVLDSVHKVLQNVSRAVGPFLTALGTMGRVIAPIIANLSNQLGGMATRFNNFITAAAKSGQLADWFNTALEVLRQLGSVAKGVFGIVKGIFKAAAGDGSSSALLTLVNTLNEAVNSINGQTGLTAVFDSFKKVGQALGPVLRGVADALVPLAGMFSDLVVGLAPGVTTVLGALKTAFTNLAPAATPVANAISAILEAVAPLLPEIGSILANELLVLAGVVQTLAEALTPLTTVIGEVMGAFASMVTQAILGLLNAILPQISNSADALTNSFNGMAPILSQIGQEFVTTFLQYMPQIASLFKQLIPVLAEVGVQLAQALLLALKQLAPFIPQIATSLALMAIAISQCLIELAPMLPTIVPLVAQFLIWSLKSGSLQSALLLVVDALRIMVFGMQQTMGIISGVIGAWQAVNTFFGKTLPHAFSVAWNFAKQLWDKFYANVIGPIKDYFTKHVPQWTGTLVGKVKSLWQGMLDRVTGIWHALYNNVIGPVKDFFTKKIPAWTGTLVGKVKSLWQSIYNRLLGIWHAVYNNVISPIKNFFTQKIPQWTGLLAGKVKSLWQGILNRVTGIWHALYNNVVSPIKNFFTKSIPSWTGTMAGKVKSLWNGMKDRVVSIWHGFYNNVISPIKNFFTKKIPSWAGTLVGKVKSLWGDMGTATRRIWNKMKDYVKGPVKGILGIAKSMFQAVQKIADKFKIPGVPGMAKSAISTLDSWRGKVDKWATGGAIHGAGTGTSDSIPAYLSNNEHVWTAKEVKAIGGHGRMMMLRQAALRGDIHPAYAKGGPVTHLGAPGFAAGGGYSSGNMHFVPNLIAAIARKFQNGVRMTSGYRSFQTEGHADYHNMGLAADLVSGNMDRLAASFYKVPSYLLEEIHTRANSNTGWYVKNGKRVSNTFYGANVPLHRDHVHIAMSRASAESLYGKLSGKHGASLLDEIKAFAGSLAGGPVSLFDWATDVYDKYFKKYVTQITDFGKGKNGALGDIGSGVMKKLADGTMDVIKPKFSDVLGALGGGSGTGYAKGIPTHGTLASWIRQAMKLTHVDGKPGWFNKLYSIAMRESRGDPRAVNDYDINAKIGDPTKGVMQIRSSYIKKFHQPGTSYNLFDPIANISAAINYIKSRYGTPFNTPATYYDNGGVLRPGFTPVVNHTGRDEYVFRNDQVQHLAQQGAALAARQIAAMSAAGRGGPGLVVNARELNLDTLDYQRLSAKMDRQRVLDGLLVP